MKLYAGENGWATSNWSTFDAKSYSDNLMSEREAGRSAHGKTVDGGDGSWSSLRDYSVVGINANEVPNMVSAIKTYVKGITDHIAQIEPLATADNAFKNEEVQTAIKNYIAKVQEYCMNLVSQLEAFATKLEEVKSIYEQNMQTLASNIGDSTASINSGSTYSA